MGTDHTQNLFSVAAVGGAEAGVVDYTVVVTVDCSVADFANFD